MEARESRLARSRREQPEDRPESNGYEPRRTLDDGTPIREIQRLDDLSAFGIGTG